MRPVLDDITCGAELARLAAQAVAQGHGHTAELLLAASRGVLDLGFLLPGAATPREWMETRRGPAMAVISDDPGSVSLGPAGFPGAADLVAWASLAAVHAAAGDIAHYRNMVELTGWCRRFLLIETSSGRAREWMDLLAARQPYPLRCFVVLPRGGLHPIAPAGG